MEQFIDLEWGTEVTAQDIMEAIWEGSGDASFVEIINEGVSVSYDYVPGRVRIFLDENNRIWQIAVD